MASHLIGQPSIRNLSSLSATHTPGRFHRVSGTRYPETTPGEPQTLYTDRHVIDSRGTSQNYFALNMLIAEISIKIRPISTNFGSTNAACRHGQRAGGRGEDFAQLARAYYSQGALGHFLSINIYSRITENGANLKMSEKQQNIRGILE